MRQLIVMRTLLLVLFPLWVNAQFTYRVDTTIPVSVDGHEILNPWAGGLNSPQVSTIDLNHDGQSDLVIFDKMASRILTFLANGNSWHYAPDYEWLFPEGLSTFVLLRDFDQDGRKDLFTFGQIGIFVYRNVTASGQPLSWQKLSFFNAGSGLYSEVLLTTGFSGKINLLPGNSDLPNFTDMDGDGDLDVVNMRFVSPGTAEYHKNFSMELYGIPDSLELVRQTTTWGGFTECSCGKIAFGTQTCEDIGGRTQHNGGKALLTFDMDHDGDQDAVFSEEDCESLYFMENQGDVTTAVMNSSSLFPTDLPVNISQFPAAYLEDVNFDGKVDLLSAPNLSSRMEETNNFSSSLLLYTNVGSNDNPSFQFAMNNFLQRDMIDVGDISSPAFVDYNLDGDQDLFIGTYSKDLLSGSIYYFENTGTTSAPIYTLVTDDFLELSGLNLTNIKPQFADIDRNGALDLTFTATKTPLGVTQLYYVPNSSSTGFDFQILPLQYFNFSLSQSENLTLVDIDRDGWQDILLGTVTGALQYWHNNGANHFSLANDEYLGLGESTDRLYLAAFAGDLDADGYEDLVVGDYFGTVSVFGAFRESSAPNPVTSVVYNSYSKSYQPKNLGGRVRPVVAKLYGNDKPEIVVGNALGGLHVLKNDNGKPLPDNPEILIFPNPISSGFPLNIKSDRNATMDIFTSLGQRIGTSLFVPANQIVTYPIQGIASGLYIARFSYGSNSVGKRFIIK